MLEFFKDLISNKPNSPGTKRFVAIWCLILFTIEVIIHLITKVNIQGEILIVTAGLITVPLGLNTILSSKDISKRGDVATTVVENNPADQNAEDAKDIMNGEPSETKKEEEIKG